MTMDKPKSNLYDLRINYSKASLNKTDVQSAPVDQFQQWFDEALNSQVYEPNAMVLSTVNEMGQPAARVVLLKDIRENGFVFFTNYNSDKARELEANPACSLVFLWHELERQIRIEGEAYKIDSHESDAYFAGRPYESRIGAWTSPQSKEIESREELEHLAKKTKEKFKGKEVTRPEFWGGYIVIPRMMEFWQGRPGRLHDRIRYVWESNRWKVIRLAP